jgi:general secretion pathway protein D
VKGRGEIVSTSVRLIRSLAVVVLAMALAGCAAQKAYHRAERAMERQNYDEAVLNYSKAVALSPGNTRYELSLERAKLKAAHEHFQRGKRFVTSEQWELAIAEFQQSLLLHPGHQFATSELEKAVRELRRRQIGPSEIEQLKEQARRLDSGPPQLDPIS